MRDVLFWLLSATGVARWWRLRHRDAIVILTVHGVSRRGDDGAWRPLRERLTADRLDRCLTVLRRHYRFIALDDAVDMLAGRKPVEPSSMVLTFDDGYRTQIEYVAPVLRRHGVPATIFVSTGHVDTRAPFWFDRLDYVLQALRGERRDVTIAGSRLTIDATSRERLAASYAELRTAAKSLGDEQMRRELAAIAETLEHATGRRLADIIDGDPWSAVLTRDDIRAAPPELSFGSHTVDHARVAYLPATAARRELKESKHAIESWTARPCRHFCYPDGACNVEAARLVRESGYESAVTTDRGMNRRGDVLMRLKRVDLPAGGSEAALLADVSGLFDWLLSVRNRLRGD